MVGRVTDCLHSITIPLARLCNILRRNGNMMHSPTIRRHLLRDSPIPSVFFLRKEVVCLEEITISIGSGFISWQFVGIGTDYIQVDIDLFLEAFDVEFAAFAPGS